MTAIILLFLAGCSKEELVVKENQKQLKASLVHNGIYEIEFSTNSNKVLDLRWGEDANGAVLRPWDRLNNTAQQWIAIDAGNGNWRFVSNASASGRCIDLANGDASNGTSVRLWESYNNNAQTWQVSSLGNDYFSIKSVINTSKGWDTPNCVVDGTQNLQLWDYYGTSCQRFKFNFKGMKDGSSGSSPNPTPYWKADARCFFDGGSGSFDDIAVKDPSIIYSGGKYHMFYTGRDNSLWRMGYASASTIAGLSSSAHTFMSTLNGGGYFCAPQVFNFTTKGRWYLIYQSGQGATFSTNSDVGNPYGWSAGRAMGIYDGIDFWCISDGGNVYVFYSAQDGSSTIKRRRTSVANFPYGWSSPTVVATNTFEAPHVYKNLADGKYYMIVEDMARHQELWVAGSLGGTWTKVNEYWADASRLSFNADHWTDQVSHVEAIRTRTNEYLEVNDLNKCDLLIQGVLNGNYGDYSRIPYDLGVIRNY